LTLKGMTVWDQRKKKKKKIIFIFLKYLMTLWDQRRKKKKKKIFFLKVFDDLMGSEKKRKANNFHFFKVFSEYEPVLTQGVFSTSIILRSTKKIKEFFVFVAKDEGCIRPSGLLVCDAASRFMRLDVHDHG